MPHPTNKNDWEFNVQYQSFYSSLKPTHKRALGGFIKNLLTTERQALIEEINSLELQNFLGEGGGYDPYIAGQEKMKNDILQLLTQK